MSQPIEVGSILGGRYQVTEFVMTTAEGDLVLEGIDQVLNRSVSILVASTDNSSQLAGSAREIAMDERVANVQVLDLGVTDTNQSYLVTNLANSADLLDLVIENDAPYVEPFFTDTLGTEIFGESRQAVPQTYEDDDEYYQHLAEDEDPQEQGRIGNALSSGLSSLGGLKHRFGRKNAAQPDEDSTPRHDEPEPTTAPTSTAPATQPPASKPAQQETEPAPKTEPTSTASEHTAPIGTANTAAGKEPKPTDSHKPRQAGGQDDEPNVTATAALSSAGLSKGQESPKQPAKPTSAAAKPGAPAKKPASKAPQAAGSATAAGSGAKASIFPAGAKGVPAAATATKAPAEEETSSKGSRLLVGAILIAVLVIGVIVAFNFLGSGKDEPVAQGPATDSSQPADPNTPDPSASPTQLPAPEVSEVSRLVPGNQSLNEQTDDTLPLMIDGNPASAYTTFSYTTPNFGGFASNMVFILSLEEESKISEVTLDGLNASGGTYQILIGDSDDLGDATSVANGSFTGPSLQVPVNQEQSTGRYVFLNVTELPRRASGANPSRPYGLQIGEFSVK